MDSWGTTGSVMKVAELYYNKGELKDEDETPRMDPAEINFKVYIIFLLEGKYSFQRDSDGFLFWDEHEPHADIKSDHHLPKYAANRIMALALASGVAQANQMRLDNEEFLKDIDFILGLIDKISPQILNYGMFQDLYEKLYHTERNKYLIEELLRKSTNDFTKNDLTVFNNYFPYFYQVSLRLVRWKLY